MRGKGEANEYISNENKTTYKERFDNFLNDNFVCIGWPLLDDLSRDNKEDIKRKLENEYSLSGHKLGNALGSVNTFINTMQNGDIILIVNKNYVYIGIVGEYEYLKEHNGLDDGTCHRRKVIWQNKAILSEIDISIKEFLKNRNLISKFPKSISETEFNNLIAKGISLKKEDSEKLESLMSDALRIIEEELNSEDPERRLKAATELLRLNK